MVNTEPHRSPDKADLLTVAIGDVHGHLDKLEGLLQRIRRHADGSSTRLVFIGDYVDRGPASRGVIELLMEMTARDPDGVICLRGNHEAVVVAAAADRFETLPKVDFDTWMNLGGGAATLRSYGVATASDLPADHVDWMVSRPVSFDDGLRLYVHAGVNPERTLGDQRDDDMIWIREPFLSHARMFDRLIVHGHTPVSARIPDWRANRLNLDTAAGYGGPLTAAVFNATRREPLAFLTHDRDSPLRADLFEKRC